MSTESYPHIHLVRGSAGCLLAVRQGAIAIVVDALRASTTIAALFAHGADRVLVVARVEDALSLAAEMPGVVLVGERSGERLPGFHLGNSPLEVLASPRMDGQTVIFTSSNGAQRLTACYSSDRILVGTVSNASAIARFVRLYAEQTRREVVLISAGKYPDEQYHSPEDDAVSAYLAMRIGLPIAEDSHDSFAHWEQELVLQGLEAIFCGSQHARRLMEIGYSEDVFFCARPDTYSTLPAVLAPIVLNRREIGVEVRELI